MNLNNSPVMYPIIYVYNVKVIINYIGHFYLNTRCILINCLVTNTCLLLYRVQRSNKAPSSIKEGVGFVGPLASQTSQPTSSIYLTSQNELSQRTIWYQVIPSKKNPAWFVNRVSGRMGKDNE